MKISSACSLASVPGSYPEPVFRDYPGPFCRLKGSAKERLKRGMGAVVLMWLLVGCNTGHDQTEATLANAPTQAPGLVQPQSHSAQEVAPQASPQAAPRPTPTPANLPQLKRLWQQGAAAKHRGDYEGARRAWRNALALAPQHASFQDALNKLPKTSRRSKARPPVSAQTPAGKKPAGYRKRLRGSNPVRIVNPFPSSVMVFLRSKSKGSVYERGVDFRVKPQESATVYAPNGHYDIFFTFSDKPNQLFQGDSFDIDYFGVQITLEMVANGNYGMHEVY